MLAGLFIAFAVAMLAALLTACESRLKPTESLDELPEEFPREPAPISRNALPIVAQRARCCCGHAFERHALCVRDDCGCGRFDYAGGLVEPVRAESEAVALSA